MHIPTLLPDELIGGYLGRIAILNGLDGAPAALKALLQVRGRPRGRTACPTPFEVVSATAQVSKPLLIGGHSLLPLRRLVSPGRVPIAHGAAQNRAIERRALAELLMPGARRCSECIREDIQFWGFAYDRRSAQLSGVDWCTKHGIRLEPSRGMAAAAGHAIPAQVTPAEQRYADIFDALLELPHSVPLSQACIRLRQRSQHQGLRWRSNANGPTMTDLAQAIMPTRWLHQNQPHVLGRSLNQINTVAVVPFAAHLYVLALAVLYDSAADALAEFLRPLTPSELEHGRQLAQRRAGRRPEILFSNGHADHRLEDCIGASRRNRSNLVGTN